MYLPIAATDAERNNTAKPADVANALVISLNAVYRSPSTIPHEWNCVQQLTSKRTHALIYTTI